MLGGKTHDSFDLMEYMVYKQNRIEDLEKERDEVADQMAMAKEQLKDTRDLLTTLDDSKKVMPSW